MNKTIIIALLFLFVPIVTVGQDSQPAQLTVKSKCTGSVEKALKATPGVEKVEVSLDRKEAVVEYDDAKVTEAKLREVINSTGFKAVEEKSGSQ